MKKLMICLLGLPLALSGCVTAEEMAAQDSDACHSYGAPTGSTAYFQCRMLKDQQHAEQRAVALAQFNRGLENFAAATAPPRPIIYAPNLY